MLRIFGFLAILSLALGLGGCAECMKSEGCCTMCASGCRGEDKAMKCGQCEKKEAAAGCCSKGTAEGKPTEGHQH